jgi:hypothetical protein
VADESARKIGARSDAELYEMLFVAREDWTAEALKLADEEWKRRDLTPQKRAEAQVACDVTKGESDAINSEPLSTGQKALFFLFNFAFCLGIPQIVLAAGTFRSRGYEQKFRDSIIWMAYGVVSFIAIFWMVKIIIFLVS